jgi:hypothetical protein
MTTIYIVRGNSRYPEDDDDWLVRAFRDEAKAAALKAAAQARNDYLTAEYERTDDGRLRDFNNNRNEHDPEWQAYTTYEVVPLELEEV